MTRWGISAALPALLGALALGAALPAHAGCGDAQRASPTYKAFQACKAASSSLNAHDYQGFKRAMDQLAQTPYCALLVRGADAPAANRGLCADPNGYLCRYRGNLMDSACNIDVIEAQNADKVPTAVDATCKLEADWARFGAAHYPAFKASNCASVTHSDCTARFNAFYSSERAKMERDIAYPQAKIDSLIATLKTIKKKYIDLLSASTRIPPAAKLVLIDKIKATHLGLETMTRDQFLNSSSNSDCYNTTPGAPLNTILYNSGGSIEVCIGQMYTIDNLNPYLLAHLMAHEVSHSIDPCALERAAFYGQGLPAAPAPNISTTYFPGLLQCLRGGAGAAGCTNAILHCTTPAGVDEECGAVKNCRQQAAAMPSCRWSGHDSTQNGDDASDYRHQGAPREQIGESFADYMGAQIVGEMIKDDARTDRGAEAVARRQRDALTAITSEFSRLHGPCLKSNTLDEHPPGYLRVNRVIMSSPAFQEGMGCAGGPPKTKDAGVTCDPF